MGINTLEKLADGGIQKSELNQSTLDELNDFASKATPEQAKPFLEKLNQLLRENHNEEVKAILQAIADKVSLRKDLESKSNPKSFDSLKEKLEGKETIQRLMGKFDDYIDVKLGSSEIVFSSQEKESIKLVVWGEFQKLFSGESALGKLMNTAGEKAKEFITGGVKALSGKSEEKSLKQFADEAEKFLDDFGSMPDSESAVGEYLYTNVGKKIDDIIAHKKENTTANLENISSIGEIIGSEKLSSDDIYKQIEQETLALATSLEDSQQLGIKLGEEINNLPAPFAGGIKDIIQKITENFPILGWLIGIIMGEDFLGEFLSGKEQKRKSSLKGLSDFAKKQHSPIGGFFEESLVTNMDPKSLKYFFDFVEEKGIDYADESFWEEFLTGNTKNNKIKELYSIFVQEDTSSGKLIVEKSDFRNDGEGFIKKLNSVEQLANREEMEKNQNALKASAADLPAIPMSGIATQVNDSVPTETADSVIAPTLSGEENTTQPITPSNAPLETTVTMEPETPINNSGSTPHGQTVIAPTVEETKGPSLSSEQPTTLNTPKTEDIPVKVEKPAQPSVDMAEIKRQYEKFRDDAINLALQKHTSIPIIVDYQGKEAELKQLGIETPKVITFLNGNIMIDNSDYKVTFGSFQYTGSMFGLSKTVTVEDLQIEGVTHLGKESVTIQLFTQNHNKRKETEIPKPLFEGIVLSLIQKGEYTGKIPAKGDIPEIEVTVG